MRRKYIPLITGLLLLLGAHVSLALTLTEVRTAIRRNVRDTASSSSLQRYTDAMLTAIVNEGQRDVVNNTWCLTKSQNVTVTAASDVSSALSTDVIKVYRVLADGLPLPETTFAQLDADTDFTQWNDDSDSIIQYYIFDRNRYSGTTNTIPLITVFPRPTGTTPLIVYYYAQPTDLSADADIPFNSQSWLNSYDDLLVWYGTYRLLFIEGMAEKSRVFKDLYDTRLQQLYTDYGAKEARVPPIPTKEQRP